MALVFLGIGFTPIIEWYIKALSPEILYWVNTTSAILDNATLASANIISANKLGITSKEWAKLGLPLGAVIMVVYYIILFWLEI
jgi:predicted cation transporter